MKTENTTRLQGIIKIVVAILRNLECRILPTYITYDNYMDSEAFPYLEK